MKLAFIVPSLLLSLGAGSLAAQRALPASCTVGPTALVLSGGGAKGMAHVGVIQALDSAGILPDMIVGASMGSLIGALYSSGYSGNEIDSLVHSYPLSTLFNPRHKRGPEAWSGLLPMLRWYEGDHGFVIQSNTQRNDFNTVLSASLLRGNLIARGDFDNLVVPLRVIATDVRTRKPVVLRSGDLAQAVRASIAVPLALLPERIRDTVLVDGGISANIPIALARKAGAQRVLVSDVTSRPADSLDFDSPVGMASRLIDWLFDQPVDSVNANDLMMRSPIDGFAATDYSLAAIDSLIHLGRHIGDSLLRTWHCAPSPRQLVHTTVPLTRTFGSIQAIEGDSAANELLSRALRFERGSMITDALLKVRVLRLTDRELFREFWLNPGGTNNQLDLHPIIRTLPRRTAGVAIAFDGELGGRAWAGFLDRRAPILHSEVAALLKLGRFRSTLDLTLRRASMLGQSDFSPVLSSHLGTERIRRFQSDGSSLSEDVARDVIAQGGLEHYFTRSYRISLGGEWRSYEDVGALTRAHAQANTKGGYLLFEKLGEGGSSDGRLELLGGKEFSRGTFEATVRGVLGGVRLEQRVRLGAGKDLPVSLTLPLGGEDGFPGLHLGARRGDREVFTSLTAEHRFFGPLNWRVTGAAGSTSWGKVSGDIPNTDGEEIVIRGEKSDRMWLAGGKVGVGADTPVGPLFLEYGRTIDGREAFFIRVGRWF